VHFKPGSGIDRWRGVPVVYDSIGRDTFMDSLACLRPMGMMVSFGNASGPVETFDPGLLGKMGSLFLTRPSLFTYSARRQDLLAMADELFSIVLSGQVRLSINQRFPLHDAAVAHQELEARRTTGSTVLFPRHERFLAAQYCRTGARVCRRPSGLFSTARCASASGADACTGRLHPGRDAAH
jgi:NADPH:quinone reductase-like Zn-dependent oxidoreductase